MVLIFRAKSCLTCRSSKRRCDTMRPTCSSCKSSGRECNYQVKPNIVFVTENQVSSRSQIRGDRAAENNVRNQIVGHRQSLNNSTLEYQLRQAFWSNYFPKYDHTYSGLAQCFNPSTKFAQILDSVSVFAGSQPALDACALTMLGRMTERKDLLHRGMINYGKAVSQLQIALAQPCVETLSSLIYTCRLLSLYEMMRPEQADISTQGPDWKKHLRASCSLMKSEQATSDPSGVYGPLYLDMKRLAFRLNFTSREPQFIIFEAPQLSSTVAIDGLDLQEQLYFAMDRLPLLLEQSDDFLRIVRILAIPRYAEKLHDSCLALLNDFACLDDKLKEWETSVLMRYAATASGETCTTAALWSISMSHGYGFLLACNEYWATRMVIHCQAQYLADFCKTELDVHVPGPKYPSEHLWKLISNIANSAPRLLSPAAGIWISEQSVYPLATCMHTLAGLGGFYSEEMSVIKTAMSNARGAAFTHGFLKSVAADSPKTKGRRGSFQSKSDLDQPTDAVFLGTSWYN